MLYSVGEKVHIYPVCTYVDSEGNEYVPEARIEGIIEFPFGIRITICGIRGRWFSEDEVQKITPLYP